MNISIHLYILTFLTTFKVLWHFPWTLIIFILIIKFNFEVSNIITFFLRQDRRNFTAE